VGRWTDGDATISVPLASIAPEPEALVLQLFARQPNGAQLIVEANDLKIFEGRVPGAVSTLRMPLPLILRGANALKLRFKSDTFSPSDAEPSPDRRRLGIFLLGVEVQSFNDDKSPRGNAELKAHVVPLTRLPLQVISGDAAEPILIRVINSGRATWNREPTESRTAVALGTFWRREGGGAPRISESRVALPANVRPGEFVTLKVVLRAVDGAGKPLPPGNYMVTIDMVAELQAWFGDVGSQPLSFAIQVIR
jgi:hypothetical protein